TYSHMAALRLVESGAAKFIVTSNHDNLHKKSGIPDTHIAELFGNAYVEVCTKCKKQYARRVVTPSLGRVCDDPSCSGRLVKTGVRFGQATPQEPLERATQQSKQCDVALVLGSGMSVAPFC